MLSIHELFCYVLIFAADASGAQILQVLPDGPDSRCCESTRDSLYAGSVLYSAVEAVRVIWPSNDDGGFCVVDGRLVLAAACTGNTTCTCSLGPSEVSYGLHTVAAYSKSGNNIIAIRSNDGIDFPLYVNITKGAATSAEAAQRRLRQAAAAAPPPGQASLGVYYTTYQQEDNQIYQNITRMYGWTWSMEDILRNSSQYLADSIWRWAPAAASPAWVAGRKGIMQHQPVLGMYCYYRHRVNNTLGLPTEGYIANCPEASHVLQTHAAEMSAIGIDYVTPDATNWDQDPHDPSNGADLHQLRPTEVLAEEWANMRLQGLATPQLGTYDRVNSRTNPTEDDHDLWTYYLTEFFNNQTLLDLDMVWKTKDGRFKIYTIADEPTVNYTAVRAIEANGGAHDIVTPWMWSAPDPSGNYEANGFLKYFSPCVANTSEGLRFSTDVAVIDLDTPCNHYKTPNSPVGSVWTVSTCLPMNNVPFGGAKFNGLFLKKQFWDILADPNPTDYIFMPSWNEFIVGATNTSGWDMTNPWFYSLGVHGDDPDRHVLFMDGFGRERSRTIEPSIQDGGRYYKLLASCMRVYRLQQTLGIFSNGTGCDVQGEECCTVDDDQRFTLVWSFDSPSRAISGTPDTVLANTAAEAATWMAQGWQQVCSPWDEGSSSNGGPTGVCGNSSLPWTAPDDSVPTTFDAAYSAVRGPFMLYQNVSTSDALNGSVPFVRCVVPASAGGYTRHFVANSTVCASPHGTGTAEYILGYGSTSRDSLFVRDVHRCFTPLGQARCTPAARPVTSGPSDNAVESMAGISGAHRSHPSDGRSALGGSWYFTVNGPCASGDVDEGIVGYAI